jgi:predicted PurR-regulated permease PerM
MKKIAVAIIAVAIIFVIVLGITPNVYAQAQNEPSAEEQQKMMEDTMSSMLPFMGKMIEITMKVQFETLAKSETAESLASYTKNYYDALIRKGFTKEEALKIATNTGIPSFPSMQK